jgi:DNA-binding transcriptional MerR regulator
MAWSTRQLAELAGTTVKAVRHYHALGILDEPERASNNYKQYEAVHLLRLLQIKRLSDLGLSLSQIAEMGRAEYLPDEAIRMLDLELQATIARLQGVRDELAVILEHQSPIDLPAGFGAVARELTARDRAMLLLYSHVLDERAMADLLDLVSVKDPLDDEFDALPSDADADAIRDLAERMVDPLIAARAAHPAVQDPGQFALVPDVDRTVAQMLAEVYNPAQLEVLWRANQLIEARQTD